MRLLVVLWTGSALSSLMEGGDEDRERDAPLVLLPQRSPQPTPPPGGFTKPNKKLGVLLVTWLNVVSTSLVSSYNSAMKAGGDASSPTLKALLARAQDIIDQFPSPDSDELPTTEHTSAMVALCGMCVALWTAEYCFVLSGIGLSCKALVPWPAPHARLRRCMSASTDIPAYRFVYKSCSWCAGPP